MAGTSTNATENLYSRGWVWWNENAFWRNNAYYSEKTKAYFEKWLEKMRANERRLIRLE